MVGNIVVVIVVVIRERDFNREILAFDRRGNGRNILFGERRILNETVILEHFVSDVQTGIQNSDDHAFAVQTDALHGVCAGDDVCIRLIGFLHIGSIILVCDIDLFHTVHLLHRGEVLVCRLERHTVDQSGVIIQALCFKRQCLEEGVVCTGQAVHRRVGFLCTNLFGCIRVAQCGLIKYDDRRYDRIGIDALARIKTLIQRFERSVGLALDALLRLCGLARFQLFRFLCIICKGSRQDAQHHDQSKHDRKYGSCFFHPCILLINISTQVYNTCAYIILSAHLLVKNYSQFLPLKHMSEKSSKDADYQANCSNQAIIYFKIKNP